MAPKYKNKKKIKTKDGDDAVVYEYSDAHLSKRDKEKADKVNLLASKMDTIVKDAKKDLDSKDQKKRLSALAVLLIDHTYERVGNEDSAKDGHYGVTTWDADHITIKDKKAIVKYVGKSGVDQVKEVTDPRLVTKLQDLKKSNGCIFDTEDEKITAKDVNEYLKKYDITAKDIRGYHANRLVQEKLKSLSDSKDRKKDFLTVIDEVSDIVGHEPSTLRNQYLAPSVEKDFVDNGDVKKTVRAMDIDTIATKLATEHISPIIRTAGEIRHIKDIGPVRRHHTKTHNYRGKDLKSLTKILWHVSVGLGHISSAMNQFTRQKSVHISPDGRLGGIGYDKAITEIRKDLYSAVEVLSAIQDTLYDEVKADHWQPKIKELPAEDQGDVEEMLEDVQQVRNDPDSFGDTSYDNKIEDDNTKEDTEDEYNISVFDEEDE